MPKLDRYTDQSNAMSAVISVPQIGARPPNALRTGSHAPEVKNRGPVRNVSVCQAPTKSGEAMMPTSASEDQHAQKLRGASKQFVLERERIVAFISGVRGHHGLSRPFGLLWSTAITSVTHHKDRGAGIR